MFARAAWDAGTPSPARSPDSADRALAQRSDAMHVCTGYCVKFSVSLSVNSVAPPGVYGTYSYTPWQFSDYMWTHTGNRERISSSLPTEIYRYFWHVMASVLFDLHF